MNKWRGKESCPNGNIPERQDCVLLERESVQYPNLWQNMIFFYQGVQP